MDITPVGARKVDIPHYVGSRLVRVTFAGRVIMSDGTYRDCGHENHPTVAHVRACVQKLVNKINREG
jgi:hypothetical protein